MQHIVVEVHDQDKADLLYELLHALNFVIFLSSESINNEKPLSHEQSETSQDFFSYAGLWAGRDMTVTSLRQQAWPRQYS